MLGEGIEVKKEKPKKETFREKFDRLIVTENTKQKELFIEYWTEKNEHGKKEY